MEPKELAQSLAALMRQHWLDLFILELHEEYATLLAGWQRLLRTVILRLQALRLVGQLTEVRLLEQSADYGTRVVRVKDLAQLSSLPTHTALSHGDATMECCICLSPFAVVDVETLGRGTTTTKESEGVVVQTVGCGHLFHQDCLTKWILMSARSQTSQSDHLPLQEPHRWMPGTTCPLCRSELVAPTKNSPI
jgi:RING-type zinc-finger